MYELLEKIEALVKKWEDAPYTGDLASAAKANCAWELRKIIGPRKSVRRRAQDETSNDDGSQGGYWDDELPF